MNIKSLGPQKDAGKAVYSFYQRICNDLHRDK